MSNEEPNVGWAIAHQIGEDGIAIIRYGESQNQYLISVECAPYRNIKLQLLG